MVAAVDDLTHGPQLLYRGGVVQLTGNRRVIAVMRQRLERGEPVVPMYGPLLGLAWLQRKPRSPSSSSSSERLVDLREQALRSPPVSR